MAIPVIKFDKTVPTNERLAVLAGIEVGDQIDIVSILGRRATTIVFETTDPADTVEFMVNNLLRKTRPVSGPSEYLPQTRGMIKEDYLYWADTQLHTQTGSVVTFTFSGVFFSSLEITDLTLSIGTVITVTLY